MKLSYNWLLDYLPGNIDAAQIEEAFTAVGLEIEDVQPYTTAPAGVEDITIGQVVKVWPHPNADKLRVTLTDVGGPEPLQIVCGAPNVAMGQKVAVALPGVTLFPAGDKPFKISKSKIRGEVSHGMLCAEDEIGLGESHDGIIVLPGEAQIGASLTTCLNVYKDTVFEIGLTPNRVDAANHEGAARDLCAFFRVPLQPADLPEAAAPADPTLAGIIHPEDCKRLMVMKVSGIEVKESPEWIRSRLNAIGIRAINNVVDATNYVMLDMGQPLHAYESLIVNGALRVRKARAGESLVTLDSIERTLNEDDLVIADERQVLGLAGVFGGLGSGVNGATTEILLEAACFAPAAVRRTARHHGLNTDASFRFERGLSPERLPQAVSLFLKLLSESCPNINVESQADSYPVPECNKVVSISLDYINSLAGLALKKEEIAPILLHLGYSLEENESGWQVRVPGEKVDVSRPVDIVEDILRIHGLNKIRASEYWRLPSRKLHLSNTFGLRQKLSDFLVSQGAFEAYFLSFGPEKFAIADADESVALLNPLSESLSVLYPRLLPAGLQAVAYNLNRRQENFTLFSFGTTHSKMEGQRNETYWLAGWSHGNGKGAGNWYLTPKKLSLSAIRSTIEEMFCIAGVSSKDWTINFNENSIDYVAGNGIGVIASCSALAPDMLRRFDISAKDVFYWEVNISKLKQMKQSTFQLKEISRFPSVERDLALVVPSGIQYAQLLDTIKKAAPRQLYEVSLFDVFESEEMKRDGQKSYAFRFRFSDSEKTMDDGFIQKQMDKILNTLQKEHGVNLRS